MAVSVEGQSLGELLPLLAAKTGIALAAGRETADGKVVLFGPARPLRELLADLAALFDHRWAREAGPDGKPRYVLIREPRAKQYEERLSRAAAERLMAQLDAQVKALEETPEQLQRRPEGDLVRRLLAEPELRFPTEVYARLSREQRLALFLRKRLDFPFRDLTPPQQGPLRSAYRERRETFERFAREQAGEFQRAFGEALKEPGARLFFDRPEDLEKGSLRFRARQSSGSVFVGMGLGLLPFRADVLQDEFGKTSLSTSMGFWVIGLLDGRAAWVLPAHGDPYTLEPVPEVATLPAAEGTRAAGREEAWIDRLRELAAKSGRPVLADFYRSKPLAAPPAGSEPGPEPVRALDELCLPVGYLWWARDRSLLFRKRDWYEQRRCEPPDRWLVRAGERLRERGGVPRLADALLAAELSAAQVSGLESFYQGEFTYDEETYSGLPELLALLKAGLVRDGPLRPHAAGAPGPPALRYRDLNRGQLSLLPAFIRTRDYPVPPEEARSLAAWIYAVPEKLPEGRSPERERVGLAWTLGTGQEMPFTFSLPLRLPDDRRSRTVIEPVS